MLVSFLFFWILSFFVLRCGANFPVRKSGRPSVCNPLSDSPCCSPSGYCGSTPAHCNCRGCFRSPSLSDQSFWSYAAIGSAPSPHVGVPSLLPLALGYLPIYAYLPGLVFFSSSSSFFFSDVFESDDETGVPSSGSSSSGRMNERESPFFLRQGGSENSEPLLLRRLLEVVRNEELGLTSPYGLRSLRKGDGMYHAGGNYWRGDVWIHITYLVLRGLQKFYLPFFSKTTLSSTSFEGEKIPTKKEKRKNKTKGSEEEDEDDEEEDGDEEMRRTQLGKMLEELHSVVRNRAVRTVEKEWEKKQSFFERYSDTDGSGKGPHPFAGWTTTYLLLVSSSSEDEEEK